MHLLKIESLEIEFAGKKILESINLEVSINQIVAIVGKSGAGKTTLLKAIAGLIKYKQGSITLENEIITEATNKIGLVFQDYFVFPWLTIENNIRIGLDYGRNKSSNEEKNKFLNWLLKSTDLLDHQDKYPHQLSGGMLQRVAICRALAANPKILLLDEPFGALDLVTRINLHQLLCDLFNKVDQAILIVTHNISEAVSLADRVILLSENPAKVVGEWKIENPRQNNNFLKLTNEQDFIVDEILDQLKKS